MDEESDSGVGSNVYGSEHSPGELSALVVSETDLSSSAQNEDLKASIGCFTEQVQSAAEEVVPKEDLKEPLEAKKEVKFIRFNVPYIQGEIQSLTPRKKWEIRVADLESLLEVEKRKNTELNKLVIESNNDTLQMRNEYEAKLLNMRNDSSLAEARREAANEKMRLLEREKDQLERNLSDTVAQHKSETQSMEMLITSQKTKLNEISKELLDKTKQLESLSAQNSRLVAKVDEAAASLARTQKHYDELIARLTEEKRVATETADSQGTKLIQVLKESKYNLGRYQQCADELNEVKESLESIELTVKKLKEENGELKIKIRVENNTIESLSEENERLRNEIEELKALKSTKHELQEGKETVQLKDEGATRKSRDGMFPMHVISSATHLLESRRQEEKILKERELIEVRETISRIEREKSVSSKERAAFEEELINERAASAQLLKDFQEYKRRAAIEIEKLERRAELQQKEMQARDIETIELRAELENAKADSLRRKEVYTINSYLRNLPSTGLWLSNKDIQEGVEKAKRSGMEAIEKAKTKAAIKHFDEELEALHEDNKQALKKHYTGKADDIVAQNNREIEDQLEKMEDDLGLAPAKEVKSYLSEFK
eukprot:TRINITY_DN12437_c0_g1_i3.p1 TRINITY_DN12437_c0_g1~~TRINITY_DN12437_c0_g1_i3.p1  ORF type:complete len:607 (-),score=187.67 TRINITY_DN12437_c0_g1_i3:203-2023(-)